MLELEVGMIATQSQKTIFSVYLAFWDDIRKLFNILLGKTTIIGVEMGLFNKLFGPKEPAPLQPKWYEGLTEEDFEDFVIAIPQMPEPVMDVLWGIADTVQPHMKWFKNNRECIRQGEPACRLNNIYTKRAKVLSSRGFSNRRCITAPVSGKIFNTYYSLWCNWSLETGVYLNSYRDCKIPFCYFYIQPLKGQINKNATRDAYSNYIDMVKYAIQNNYDPEIRLPESRFKDSDKEVILKYIKLMEDCYITVPIQIFYEYCGEGP